VNKINVILTVNKITANKITASNLKPIPITSHWHKKTNDYQQKTELCNHPKNHTHTIPPRTMPAGTYKQPVEPHTRPSGGFA